MAIDPIMPRSPPEALDMRGLFDLPEDGLVSSLALTPDGCYVLAGFGGGEVRLYAQALRTVGAASRTGTIVAQIRSKGMFSNTKVDCHVETSEDGRFVFAGLLRGSSEMLALDITDLPRWGTLPAPEEASLASSRIDLNRRIRTYSHSDGKLKGFGAAAVVRKGPQRAEWGDEYRLFCGRGIKNIHVWSFTPKRGPDCACVKGRWPGVWQCLYDTHTNGATVELVAFRNGGLEGISKSNDANVRVWDLSDPDTKAKPKFRDISNSKDTRIVFGDYAYGGMTALSLVKLDAPPVANRMEIALPESSVVSPLTGRYSPSTSRGKRHCRMLKDLAGTQDGRHVVLVCSDGMILYHRHTQAVNTMQLQPIEGLGFEEDEVRPTVALSLAGKSGLPVMMIAGVRGSSHSTRVGGGEECGKELELMALPRSNAEERDDAQVGDSLHRPKMGWPEGKRLNANDAGEDQQNNTDQDEEESASESEEEGGQEIEEGAGDDRKGIDEDCSDDSTLLKRATEPMSPIRSQDEKAADWKRIESRPSPSSPPVFSQPDDPSTPPAGKGARSEEEVGDPGGNIVGAVVIEESAGAFVSGIGTRTADSTEQFASTRGESTTASTTEVDRNGNELPSATASAAIRTRAIPVNNQQSNNSEGSPPGSNAAGRANVRGIATDDIGDTKFAMFGGQEDKNIVDRESSPAASPGGDDSHADDQIETDEAAPTVSDGGNVGDIDEVDADRASKSGADELGERKRRAGSGSGVGKVVGRRLGKKRTREETDKGNCEESGKEEEETNRTFATTNKKSRRDEGGRFTKPRRGGANTTLDEDGERATMTRGGSRGGAMGAGQGFDQLLLRDRRSRIAARALRRSGSQFDMGAIVKGMGSSWLAGGHQQIEELRVVKIVETNERVDPPPVPAPLAKFLEERQKRRNQEAMPISLREARAQWTAGLKRLHEEHDGDNDDGTERTAPKRTNRADELVSLPVTSAANIRDHNHAEGQILESGADTVARNEQETLAMVASDVIGRGGRPRALGISKTIGGRKTGIVGADILAEGDQGDSAVADDDGGGTLGMLTMASSIPLGTSSMNVTAVLNGHDITVDHPGDKIAKGIVGVDSINAGPTGVSNSSFLLNVKGRAGLSLTKGEEAAGRTSHSEMTTASLGDDWLKSSGTTPAADGIQGPDVRPPPPEIVIDTSRDDNSRKSESRGGQSTDILYRHHCLERESMAQAFFQEQDRLRRRFLAVVDRIELGKATESSGLPLRNGCRAIQTLKMRFKNCRKEGAALQNGSGTGRCTNKEVHQATLRLQEQVKSVIVEHRDMLREVVGRQRLEAGALQISQKMEVPQGSAPLLQVRVAFPQMFVEVAKRHKISL